MCNKTVTDVCGLLKLYDKILNLLIVLAIKVLFLFYKVIRFLDYKPNKIFDIPD